MNAHAAFVCNFYFMCKQSIIDTSTIRSLKVVADKYLTWSKSVLMEITPINISAGGMIVSSLVCRVKDMKRKYIS
jgi:hypothetical protein